MLAEFTGTSIDLPILTDLIRQEIAAARSEMSGGGAVDRSTIARRCQRAIDALEETRFQPAINGTGIILHTNLGRAPVSQASAEAMAAAAASYLPLEIDPASNRRGGRMDEISALLRALTGAEAALVVNNNAAAVLLVLAALSAGREVVVSRGEAVEIGGGFRIPEVIARSGCRLVEVGTTNRTYTNDYRQVANEGTSAFLKVHTSNFRVEGFTSGVSSEELGRIARELGVLFIEDLGSGTLLDTARFGLKHETTVGESIAAGASIVTFSGDKLLGGPQAGVIAGDRELIRMIERHPLARALRVDKVTLGGLCATLRHYLRGEALSEIPIWRMIAMTVPELTARANLFDGVVGVEVAPAMSSVGGGSLPGEALPSVALRITTPHPDELAMRLRLGSPRVFGYVRDSAVWIDLRTVLPEQDAALIEALRLASE